MQRGWNPCLSPLRFGSGEDSKYCLAAYLDPNGYRLNIRSLAKSVLSPDQAALIPASLAIWLNSALLAYSRQGQDSTMESAVVFGADLGASIKLSDLPVVGSALPADLMIELQSLRVMVASASLSRESVEKLNNLIPDGMNPLPDRPHGGDEAQGKASTQAALTKGFNISAVLLFGKKPRTLTLPLGGDGERTKDNQQGGVSPVQAGAQPGSKPAAGSRPPLPSLSSGSRSRSRWGRYRFGVSDFPTTRRESVSSLTQACS